MPKKHPITMGVSICAIIAAACASIVVYIVVKENSQYEAYNPESGKYELSYLIDIFFTAFGVLFILLVTCIAIAFAVDRLAKRRQNKGASDLR